MANNKIRMIGIGMLLIATMVITSAQGWTNNLRSNQEQMEQSRAWAKIDSTPIRAKRSAIIEGKTISVSSADVDRIAAKYASGNVEDGQSRAIQYLLRREALYQLGIQNGYTATDTEVDAMIKTSEEMSKDAEGREYFDAYLKEMGMTEHEYWVNQAEQFRKEIVIGKYLYTLKSENNMDSEKLATLEADLINQYLRADGIDYKYEADLN